MPATLPYPPGPDPDDVPADRPPPAPAGPLAALLAFFAAYLLVVALLLAVAGFLAYLSLSTPPAILGTLALLPAAAVLVKCLFRPQPPAEEPDLAVDITEDDEPTLWAFVRRTAEDVGAAEPRRLALLPAANAAVRPHVTAAALSTPPGYDLYLGLGLANCTNLSEFKFALAHELAHAADPGTAVRLERVLYQWLENVADGRDFLDRAWPGPPVIAAAARAVRRVIAPARDEAARRAELHADRTAAAAAGTDAGVSALRKTAAGAAAYAAALADAGTAAAHARYTADLYFHMHAAAARTGPEPADSAHPLRAEREDQLLADPIPCPIDARPPWLLFADAARVRQAMTAKVLRRQYRVPKAADRADPRAVQAFLDDDRRALAFDPRYGGVYDDRFLRPGDLAALNADIHREPWDDAKLRGVFDKLYVDAPARAAEWAALRAERRRLTAGPAGKREWRKKRLRDVDDRLARAGEWFDSLDRRAYSVFARLAVRAGTFAALTDRYRFVLAIQHVLHTVTAHHEAASEAYREVAARRVADPDAVADLAYELREARAALKKVLRDSRDLDPPPLAGFDERVRVVDYLLPEDVVSEPPGAVVSGRWAAELLRQLEVVRGRAARLHGKAVGAVLRFQEGLTENMARG